MEPSSWRSATSRSPTPWRLLAPFLYAQILGATLLGYLVFGGVPDGWTSAGAAVLVASGLYLVGREKGRRRGIPG